MPKPAPRFDEPTTDPVPVSVKLTIGKPLRSTLKLRAFVAEPQTSAHSSPHSGVRNSGRVYSTVSTPALNRDIVMSYQLIRSRIPVVPAVSNLPQISRRALVGHGH